MYTWGYKFTETDKHPDWPYFPNYISTTIKIEKIENFENLYGGIYKLPIDACIGNNCYFDKFYKSNLKNISSVDFTVLKNELIFDSKYKFSYGGTNSTGDHNINYPTHYENIGNESFELNIFNFKAYFKKEAEKSRTELIYFYQYNTPNNPLDTLFFRHFNKNYKAYLIDKEFLK